MNAEEIKALKVAHDELKATCEEQEKLIAELQDALAAKTAEAKAGKKATVTITHEKEKYEVAVPQFKLKGKKYTAGDLKKLPDVVADLVKINSAVLTKIEK